MNERIARIERALDLLLAGVTGMHKYWDDATIAAAQFWFGQVRRVEDGPERPQRRENGG